MDYGSKIVYLVQPEVLIGTDRFKIGKSTEKGLDRIKSYGKGTNILYICKCNNPTNVELLVINEFKKYFKLVCGNEYYSGNVNEILYVFYNIVHPYDLLNDNIFNQLNKLVYRCVNIILDEFTNDYNIYYYNNKCLLKTKNKTVCYECHNCECDVEEIICSYDNNLNNILFEFKCECNYTKNYCIKNLLGINTYNKVYTEDDLLIIRDFNICQYFKYKHPNSYMYYNKKWLFTDKYNVWKEVVTESQIITAVQDEIIKYHDEVVNSGINVDLKYLKTLKIFICNYNNTNRVLNCLKGQYSVPDLNMLDKNLCLIPFDDCCFDINIANFRDYKIDDYVFTTTGYNLPKYNKDYKNECLEILSSIFNDVDELNYALICCANALFGYREDIFFVIYNKFNDFSKNLFKFIFKLILGSKLFRSHSHTFLTSYKFNNEFLQLNNARVCWIDELSDNIQYPAYIVDFISSSGAISSKEKIFNPKCTLFISTNNIIKFLPRISDSSKIKLKTIVCNSAIDIYNIDLNYNNKSTHMSYYDQQENQNILLSGFLYLYIDIIKNRKCIQYTDLTIPRVFKEMKYYIIYNIDVKRWFENEFIFSANHIIPINELFASFQKSTDIHKDLKNKYYTSTSLGNFMKSIIPNFPCVIMNNGVCYYEGIKHISEKQNDTSSKDITSKNINTHTENDQHISQTARPTSNIILSLIENNSVNKDINIICPLFYADQREINILHEWSKEHKINWTTEFILADLRDDILHKYKSDINCYRILTFFGKSIERTYHNKTKTKNNPSRYKFV